MWREEEAGKEGREKKGGESIGKGLRKGRGWWVSVDARGDGGSNAAFRVEIGADLRLVRGTD